MSPLAPNPTWHILLNIMVHNMSFSKTLKLFAIKPLAFPFWVEALSPPSSETSVMPYSSQTT